MKYEVFDVEYAESIHRIINVVISENSAVNFTAENSNNSYLEFLASQGLTDEEVQALEIGIWYDLIAPAAKEEVAPVVS